MHQSKVLFSLSPILLFAALPLTAQNQTEAQYEASVVAAISAEVSSLPPATQPIVFGGNLVYANGMLVGNQPVDVLLAYVDGLKASGVQRVDLNPGTTWSNNVDTYDAVVQHIRALGMGLAINPEYTHGELSLTTFADFQTAALISYTQLAARYQPDNFVIVHEPDTMTARMGVSATVTDWDAFIRAAGPMIRQASPRTRLGAGCFYNSALPSFISASENAYFVDFATIPDLDFLTMDIYSSDFTQFAQWAALAHSPQVNKGVYIEEVWAPHYLPNPVTLPDLAQGSLDAISLLGAADSHFIAIDQIWLNGMAQFASAYGMEAITPFTTETFFAYGSPGHDMTADPIYTQAVVQALLAGMLTATSQGYLSDASEWAVKQAVSVSSASFATMPSLFLPDCGTPTSPCNANSTVAPASLVSAFGLDLANATASDGKFPTTLGGTSMTLLDSSNTSYPVQLYYAAPGQVNYYIPALAQFGPATITITSGDGTVTTGIVFVAPVMPGLYTANANGQGVPSAIAICTGVCTGWPNSIGNGQFYQDVFVCNAGLGCVPQPIGVQSGDTLVIELYGTGIRNAALSAIAAAIDSQSLPVLFSGAQGQYLGLDQINIQIPASLMGAGQVELTLTAQGVAANPVKLDLQ